MTRRAMAWHAMMMCCDVMWFDAICYDTTRCYPIWHCLLCMLFQIKLQLDMACVSEYIVNSDLYSDAVLVKLR